VKWRHISVVAIR